jgi:hypothetical protein
MELSMLEIISNLTQLRVKRGRNLNRWNSVCASTASKAKVMLRVKLVIGIQGRQEALAADLLA